MVLSFGKPGGQEPAPSRETLEGVLHPQPRRAHAVKQGKEHERGGRGSRVTQALGRGGWCLPRGCAEV
eukprot:2698123-Alexandrium_andersonii.AAC.1